MSVYKSFTTAAEHVASWKAGGPRYAKVDGWTIDAIQAEADMAARAVERASALAVDPVQAVRCGVPAVIEEPVGRDELLAANRALMARLERVGAMALGHEDDMCPACGAVRR